MRLYRQKNGRLRKVIASSLAFCAVLGFVLSILLNTGDRVLDEQLATLENAIRRATATCYALEGRYPQVRTFMSYLTENYGLVIDESRFIVQYEAIGKNIMPSIRVYPIGGGENAK